MDLSVHCVPFVDLGVCFWRVGLLIQSSLSWTIKMQPNHLQTIPWCSEGELPNLNIRPKIYIPAPLSTSQWTPHSCGHSGSSSLSRYTPPSCLMMPQSGRAGNILMLGQCERTTADAWRMVQWTMLALELYNLEEKVVAFLNLHRLHPPPCLALSLLLALRPRRKHGMLTRQSSSISGPIST